MTSAPEGGSGENPSNGASSMAAAPWTYIGFGAPDPWVEPESYDAGVPAKEGAHLTYLQWSHQADAEADRTFHSTALRLETSLAVQKQSQWQLMLDPRFQKLTLHWLRNVRNGVRIDHLSRDRMRLIQRETQLERLVINGGWTLLAVLDDVRTGDVIESAYTFTNSHPIRAGFSETFFVVPEPFVCGNFHLSVLFDSDRASMDWKASEGMVEREERRLENGRTRWTWRGRQLSPLEIEVNRPGTYMGFGWIQVSDVGRWNRLAQRIAQMWSRADDHAGLESIPEFAKPATVTSESVERLVRFIQDEFRYLSVDLATGGWVPESPGVVARQRRGDCKDLVWLACAVLRNWGVRARSILVGTGFRDRVNALLPMTFLFNHALLEVEVDGAERWFDLTLRAQGGTYLNQPVGIFGFGMPVDEHAVALKAQPPTTTLNLYALRETVHLDSRKGEKSIIEVRLWTEGFQAEQLRNFRLAQGADQFAAERLKAMRSRIPKAERTGALLWRDDRERNVCEVIECFEATGVLVAGEQDARALFDAPRSMIASTFAIPEDKPRRAPWAMPCPLEVRHAITLRSRSMGMFDGLRRKWSTPAFTATLDQAHLRGEWTRTGRFIVNVPEIGTGELAAYRTQVADFLRALPWRLFIPWGKAHPEPEAGFGKLPAPATGVATYVTHVDPALFPDAKIGEPDPHQKIFGQVGRRGRRRIPRKIAFLILFLTWALFLAVSAMFH